MKKVAWWLLGVFVTVSAATAGLIYSGLYNISALEQHLKPTYQLLEVAMRRSVRARARDVAVPALDDPAAIERGLALFEQHCTVCHGAPGSAPASFALGLTPLPANLAFTARSWSPAEQYWVIRNGIKMTGMPAWEFRLSERELWDVVAFLETLPTLSPVQYRARVAGLASASTANQGTKHGTAGAGGLGGETEMDDPVAADSAPDPERGRLALSQYACVGCHQITGVVGPDAPVGPPLHGIASRAFIAGVLPNTFDNMQRWLRSPQTFSAHNAMPDLGVSVRDARDMAAYLATLQRPRQEASMPVPPRQAR